MTRRTLPGWIWLLSGIVCGSVCEVRAETDSQTVASPFIEKHNFELGVAVGNFDSDTEDPNDPHLNEISFSLMAGWNLNRYLGLDLEYLDVKSAQGLDDFGELSRFGGAAVGASVRFTWPLADDFALYLRAGTSQFSLDGDSTLRGEPLDERYEQTLLGGGVRGNNWFVEYVSYGEIEGLYIEQARAGLMFKF